MSKNEKYLELANNLCKAIIIAVDALLKHPGKNFKDETELRSFVDFYLLNKSWIENPEPRHKNMATLKSVENALFAYFNEGSGSDIEEFWKQMKAHNLPFKRTNKLAKILKRKKIINDMEFDFVIDVIVPYQEEGLITNEEVILLNNYIVNFELKNKK